MSKENNPRQLRQAEYIALAEFRYQLRKFLRHMEEHARKLGVNPQQYQLVLAVKGFPQRQAPTIGRLAERMQLNHNSMVELVDRSERSGLLRRERSATDRRLVTLSITGEGEAMLRKLGSTAREQLRDSGRSLIEAVRHLTGEAAGGRNKPRKKELLKARSRL
jgi:DNA-binding MarR family transcriptional regulator